MVNICKLGFVDRRVLLDPSSTCFDLL